MVKMEELTMEIDVVQQNTVLNSADEPKPANDQVFFSYPKLFNSKTLLELCSTSWSKTRAKKEVQPYLRGVKWSPDGTCCLSVVNNDGVHVTELPRDLYDGGVRIDRARDILESVIHVKEAGLVYDYCWYPGMNSGCPETCCWLTTKQNAPVQMWDAFDGSLRCSYRGFNAVDEMEPALSVSFTPDGTMIVAGYKKVLRTFDVERPGRDYSEHKISSPASCLATDRNLLAVGSWNTTISLYNVTEMGTYKSIGKMHGHGGGVTHMKFTPDGLKLVSGARKDHRLLIWDIRYYRRPLNILNRVVDTNQRIYFDISPCGKYLVTGGSDGILRVWDEELVNWKNEIQVADGADKAIKFPLHNDCCNSVSIHPLRPILATGSGQYHFLDPVKLIEEDENTPNLQIKRESNSVVEYTDSNYVNNVLNSECNRTNMTSNIDEFVNEMKYSSHTENCLVFWWTGDMPEVT